MTEIINDQNRPKVVIDVKITVETTVRQTIIRDPYSKYEEVNSEEDDDDFKKMLEEINATREEMQTWREGFGDMKALRGELGDFMKEFRKTSNP